MNFLACYRRLRIGASDEGAGTADDNLFEQIEKRECAVLKPSGTARRQKVSVEVADSAGGEVTPIPAGHQRKLVVQVHQVVVDRRRRQQDDLFVCAFSAPATVAAQDAL